MAKTIMFSNQTSFRNTTQTTFISRRTKPVVSDRIGQIGQIGQTEATHPSSTSNCKLQEKQTRISLSLKPDGALCVNYTFSAIVRMILIKKAK